MSYMIEVFYDGQCPLCRREMEWLRRKDSKNHAVVFTDIASEEWDAKALGISKETCMEKIHGRLPDGSIVEGVEVFRHLYTAIGWGWWVPLSRLPGVRFVLDVCYAWFARNRMRLTGRCHEGVCKTS